jgi:hypothetical protein
MGFIRFSSNFSKSIILFEANDDFNSSNNDILEVFLDRSDLQKTTLVERKLRETFKLFMEELMTDCGYEMKVGSIPLSFKALIGKINFDFRGTVVPGLLLG